jgi:hypothetical protein
MTNYVNAHLRRLVISRAERLCEYCLIHADDTVFGCQVDHIISHKHGGMTEESNLAYACVFCNRYKGSDVGSIIPNSGNFSRFYDPRIELWSDRFFLDEVRIEGITEIGVVTAQVLRFNETSRLLERQALQILERFPSPAALRRIHRSE